MLGMEAPACNYPQPGGDGENAHDEVGADVATGDPHDRSRGFVRH
jgi:hypothetical protein